MAPWALAAAATARAMPMTAWPGESDDGPPSMGSSMVPVGIAIAVGVGDAASDMSWSSSIDVVVGRMMPISAMLLAPMA
jgi:hypothetical protein